MIAFASLLFSQAEQLSPTRMPANSRLGNPIHRLFGDVFAGQLLDRHDLLK